MGTGKTSVGTRLAADLNYAFVDLDALIEADQKMTVTAIFSRLGEPHFREVEERIVRDVMAREAQVVSTGGGAVISEANRQAFKQGGFVICLTARPEVIHERVKREQHRPLLQDADPLARIRDLLQNRSQFYGQADATIDTSDKDIDGVIKEIKERIRYAYC